jgi:hypothetical protein
MAGDHPEDAAWFQGANALGDEVIVQGEALAGVFERDVGKGWVADNGIQ